MEQINQKRAIVLGAGGFIGNHLVTKLKSLGYWVRGVDIKYHEYKKSEADDFVVADLRDVKNMEKVIEDGIDHVYVCCALMGGSQFVFTGDNDSEILHDSALMNLHAVHECMKKKVKKVFFSSSACIYPEKNQLDPDNPKCGEETAKDGKVDSCYGYEKLFAEILYDAYARNHGMDVKIARFHNIFGPYGTWTGGREKSPAALCRKVAEAKDGGVIEVWGNGKQTRSFLYIDECVEGVMKLMDSDFSGPVNIGSEEMISINDFVGMIADIAGKKINIKNIDGPVGVMGRNSDNTLIREKLDWEPLKPLRDGMEKTYKWVSEQVSEQLSKSVV
jgi:GDP-D-mannose 3',5'-epimerase